MDERSDNLPPLREMIDKVVPRSPRTRGRRVYGFLLFGAAGLYGLTIVLGVAAMAAPSSKAYVGPFAIGLYVGGSVLFALWSMISAVGMAAQILRSNSVLADHLDRQMEAETRLAADLARSCSEGALGKLQRRISLELKLSERLVAATSAAGVLLPAATATASVLPGSSFALGDTIKVTVAALLLGFALGWLLRADFLERLRKLRFVVDEAIRQVAGEPPRA